MDVVMKTLLLASLLLALYWLSFNAYLTVGPDLKIWLMLPGVTWACWLGANCVKEAWKDVV